MKLKDKLKEHLLISSINKSKVWIKAKSKLANNKVSKRIIMGIGVSVIGIAIISTTLMVTMATDVYELSIDGVKVGYVKDKENVQEDIDEVKAQLSKENEGIEFLMNEDMFACVPTDYNSKDVTLLKDKQVKEAVLKSDILKAKGWIVCVNDKNVLATKTKEVADTVLDDVKKKYQTEGSEIVEANFKENVTVTQGAVKIDSIMDKDEAISYLMTGTKSKKPYVVKDGDTYWDLAIKYGMSLDELLDANPGCDLSKLKIGTELNLVVAKPYVTVVMKEIVATTEDIDYETTYENTSSMYAGQVKIKTEGQKGKKEIKTEIVKENGIEVSNQEVESKVIEEPKNAVALKGTKAIVGYSGSCSGVLGAPMSKLQVSSGFGVNRGGVRHLGIDFRNPCGTPIYAAEAGTVIFSGYSGSYGNIVKISHGGGLQTYYAHCNTLLVSVGQTVAKGQQIATVGATGNATGYHLHFEVRLNNVPQNPWNYI
ncbi:peptidoglycan DD-metalloendopeptidase family protein [Anaerovorax odorimutans]|uniref:peptidoglycan DD-metalloendopeptidase family protein n=1 Tax=Anaerovorax odorimutans TaxID=109327 RepID=UPI000414CAEB|nr:M23 family metallopeptidase [Anaerovorax odorimutans]